MEPFKEIFNKKGVEKIALELSRVHVDFDRNNFVEKLLPQLKKFELKDRVRLISSEIVEALILPYPQLIEVLIQALASEESHRDKEWDGMNSEGLSGFLVWPLTTVVEEFGLDDFDVSMNALKEMTKRFTAEFAIRPYLIQYDDKVFKMLGQWKSDPNHHVRRLVSEGSRPNLPWGMKVPSMKDNLERNIALIEGLHRDEELYVRRSVANHLNDISRLNKKLMIATCKKWQGNSDHEDWVVRHATRSLLKKGDEEALKLHGYSPVLKLFGSMKITPKRIREGEALNLRILIEAKNRMPKQVLVDLKVGFLKKDGAHSFKVFHLRDTVISRDNPLEINKIFPVKKVTTRRHYSGKQLLSLQVNGKELDSGHFHLTV